MKRLSLKLVGLLSLLWMVTSCVDDVCLKPKPVADASMTLTLSFDTGTRASGIGDPGVDHGENTANWKNLGVYLVYKGDMEGKVLNFELTKETFQSPKVFNVYPGQADIFVVALPEGQEVPVCQNRQAVCNMKTLNVSTADLVDKNAYMRNIFSGVASGEFVKDGNNSVTVVCSRIVAKVDVQYDVQNGIENGSFVEAGMSDISFNGVPQAYIFPDHKTEDPGTLPGIASLMKLSGTISERNGRAYAYMFPGEANLNFKVTYKKEEVENSSEVSYVASFDEPLTAKSWNKVNFRVSGTTADVTGTVEVNLTTTASK